MARLTVQKLEAIHEALTCRLAGVIEDTDHDQSVYEAALDWVSDEIGRRKARREDRHEEH